jgi:predicted nuclease with TOPRIM domain
MSGVENVGAYTVREAVQMSGKSEATVRRELGGKLVKVEGAEPIRVTATSLHAWCDELRRRAPMALQEPKNDLPSSAEHEQLSGRVVELRRRIDELEHEIAVMSAENLRLATENEQLRHTVQSLRQAHVILTDELGTYTTPSIPDN